MSDVTCPYCEQEQEINHDDGYGYGEDEEYEQDCPNCDKTFRFYPSITYSYTVHCQDNDHDMVPFGEKWPNMFECSKCDFYEMRVNK